MAWTTTRMLMGWVIISSATFVAQSQPTPSTPLLLPGDGALGPAAGRQESPEISRGSAGYLTVWADNRSSAIGTGTSGPYFGEGLGTMIDVYAARLDAQGRLVDTTPIAISQAPYNQTSPRVGWNGQSWLVVWMNEREGNRYLNDVVGVRISSGGVVLDATPILIHAAETSNVPHTPWGVASDGTNWMVTWRGLDAEAGIYTIDGARIAPSGAVVDSGGKRLRQDAWNSAPQSASLAFAGDEYLMTWLELDAASWGVRGQRLTPALDPLGGVFKINLYAPTQPARPTVATDGSAFFVAWSEERYAGWAQLFGTRVSHAGVVLDPSGIPITAPAGSTMFQPSVVWDGSRWLVVYNVQKSFGDDDVYLTRVSSNGQVQDAGGIPVRTGAGTQYQPHATRGVWGGVQVAWNDATFAGDVESAPVASDGTTGELAEVSAGAPRQTQPRLASSTTGHLVVYRSEVPGGARILAQRLDPSGTAIDPEPIVMAAAPGLTSPAATWNGSHYVVVWESANEGRGVVYARRLGANGAILDPSPIPVMQGRMPDVAALGSSLLVVAADADTNPQFRYTFSVRMTAGGTVLGPPARLGGSFDAWPRVAGFAGRWLVVWEQNVTHDNVRSAIVGAFVGADGVSHGTFTISDSGFDDRPHLAVGTDTALVAWEDGDIFGRRIGADGTLFDTARGLVIAGAPEDQFRPSVAWDGARWIVAYLDHRNDPYPDQEKGDVFATRVGADGSILDPSGFAVAIAAAPEEMPAVAASGGSSLFAYSAFVTQPPYAGLRMTIRTGAPASTAEVGEVGGLLLTKSPNGASVALTWMPSCRPGLDYAIYEGSLGAWGTHVPDVCSTGGSTSSTVAPAEGSRYFLVVPLDGTTEGSYGADSSGAQRAVSAAACTSVQNTASCTQNP
jgi:hypothetical protein